MGTLVRYIGGLVVAISIIHIIAGLLLWRRSRTGAYLALGLSILEIMSYASVLLLPNLAVPMILLLGIGSVLSIILIASWDTLTR